VALPLIDTPANVATFNAIVLLLLMQVLTAYATFLLGKRAARRATEAWLSGPLLPAVPRS
jgi:hypothetical protein